MQATMTVNNRLEIRNVAEGILKSIKRATTLDNPVYKDAVKYDRYVGDLNPHIELWEEIGDGVAVPRGWGMQCLDLLKRYGIQPKLIDQKRAFSHIELTFKGELRDYQLRAVQDVTQRAFGVLEAATGSGKTIMALAIIAARKQPCLILVHTKELLHQWADRIRSFLGIEPGLIGDGKLDVQPVTVGLVHTVRKHLDELPLHFGHIVVDEAHRTPSTMFTETVQAFDSKFMLGLSATPYRRDGLTKLIYLTLGDRVHQVDAQELKTNGAVMAPVVVRRETSFQYAYADDYTKMISALVRDQDRNRQIAADVIQQARSKPGTALLVSDRVAHCNTFADLIENSGLKVRVLTGQCSKQKREQIVSDVQAGKVNVLCSTVQLLGEGFDCSGLSSLFLGTPIKFKGRLLQVVGRILRPGDGKRPIVFDYVDSHVDVLKSQAKSRERAFAELAG
ncbi:DEAD/DEAH box helicase [Desulfovermiculus halophilus]|uniref:DEAD/DEAH box helicase n=1 Tax=Desulfovermiculus halophilus TaxID=339722 RepID=UPI00055323FA|nr:DEAD/DEAH box helicase [Desulfovermiculus halophilus]